MRTILTIAALMSASTSFAESTEQADLKIDLAEVCKPGCIITLDVEGKRHVNGPYVGEVGPDVMLNPLLGFVSVSLTETKGIHFVLSEQPGKPMFSSKELMLEHLMDDRNQVRAARNRTGS